MTTEDMAHVVFDVERMLLEAAKTKKEYLLRKAAHVSSFALREVRRELETRVMDEVAKEIHCGATRTTTRMP